MELKSFDDRVIVSVDMQGKNNHTFSNGTTIRIERQWNNLNKRHTEPVNAIVVDGQNIPAGAEILIHHNATHDVHRIFNYTKDHANDIRYFSVPENMCYLWRHENEWQPLKGFATGLRVFEPIKTQFYGIAPKHLKDTLFITSGEHKNKVVYTVHIADYEVIFQDTNGQEGKIIRVRHYENENNDREEIVAVNKELTEKVLNGQIFVGLTVTDAKPILEYA